MSYSQIMIISPGEKIEEGEELKNSHGTAPVIWNLLGQRYIAPDFSFFWEKTIQKLWDLWKDPAIPLPYRAVLMFTFDRAYVSRKNFSRLAGDIDRFLTDFPEDPRMVNHWPRIAEILRASEAPAIGLYCTSTGQNSFEDPAIEDEEGNRIGYDWSALFEIYAALEAPEG